MDELGDVTGHMKKILRYVDANLSNVPLRILDIPTGRGTFARELNARGHRVIQVDISDAAGIVNANMEDPLPFATASFDMVVSLEGMNTY